jgi:hypothetical protein
MPKPVNKTRPELHFLLLLGVVPCAVGLNMDKYVIMKLILHPHQTINLSKKINGLIKLAL